MNMQRLIAFIRIEENAPASYTKNRWHNRCRQCRREDSNLHSLNGNQVLNLARLPRSRRAMVLVWRCNSLFYFLLCTSSLPLRLGPHCVHTASPVTKMLPTPASQGNSPVPRRV